MTCDFTDASPTVREGVWEPLCEGVFQELEAARLGKVLLKAWNGDYESADEVIEDVRMAAAKLGINISEDDVDIGEDWKDVFEVEGQALRFKSPT
jgi:hypothetical protein